MEVPDDQADQRVARLERRLERERSARLEAERIAEEGMRALWIANQDLERRVAERTADLERSLRAAQMASEAKETFLGELGHELSTPLHAVVGLAELIDDAALSPVDRQRLVEVRTHAEALGAAVQGLTELAGAEGASSPDVLRLVEPASWLDDVVGTWQRRLLAGGQLLVVEDRCPRAALRADWARMRTMVDAALDNVGRHGGPGRVLIELWREPTSGGATVVCAVTDSGPGMSDDEISTAMEPFVRHRRVGRLGVGLAVVERLAVSGGGRVGLTSGPADAPGVRLEFGLPATLG